MNYEIILNDASIESIYRLQTVTFGILCTADYQVVVQLSDFRKTESIRIANQKKSECTLCTNP